MEPARVEREHHGRQRLEHPDSAEQLEVDRELRRQEEDERERAGLHHQRDDLRDLRLLVRREQSWRTNSFQTFLVNRFAAAIDITAAGTSAPIAIAAKATPTNQSGNMSTKSAGTVVVRLGHVDPGGDRHIAEQRHQPEQERPCGQQRHVAAHHVLRARAAARRSARAGTGRAPSRNRARAWRRPPARRRRTGSAPGLVTLGQRLRGRR